MSENLNISIYRHKKNYNIYRVVGDVRIKDPDTRLWVPGIQYTELVGGDGNYIRYADDFFENFERVQDDELKSIQESAIARAKMGTIPQPDGEESRSENSIQNTD